MSELKHVSRAARQLAAAISSGLLLSACAPELPIGRFACHTDRDCPDGWSCAPNARGEDRCFPAGTDFDWIRGSGDSGGAGELAPEAGPMSTDPDAATPPPPDKPEPPAAGRGGSSPPSPAAGSGGSPAAGSGGAPQPTAGGPSEPPPPPVGGCKEEAPDASKGVFVSPTGVTAADCGSAAQPCSTVQRGIERAKASKRELVYLDSGTYSEPVVLQAGLHLQGGYSRVQADWKRLCAGDRAQRARIDSPTEVGLWAEYDGDSTLETLTIQTLPQAPAGHSMYGLFARGSSTRLKLREVNLLAASGGNGKKGTDASTPDQRTGTCTPAADGTNGTTVGRAGEPGAAGSFTELGYVPGDGTPGGAGQPGKNGVGGQSYCRDCVDTCNVSTCQGTVVGQSCGIAGGSGCGGLGAAGGGEGLGGGSSIGLFVWAARVEVEGGLLQAGDGGSGGLGGDPGQGGLGSDGGPAMNGASCTVCIKSTIIIDPPPVDTTAKNIQANKEASATDSPAVGRPVPVDGGIIPPPVQCVNGKGAGTATAGTRGGSGSAGGPGGAGGGGNSYGTVAAGQGRIDISNSTQIQIGKAGKSQGDGATGEASAMKQVL